MAKKILGPAPFEVRVLDVDSPLTLSQLVSAAANLTAVSLCIRSRAGHPRRGGYFFHLSLQAGRVTIYDFEGQEILALDESTAVRFINHVAGLQFDAEMLVRCQNDVNLRQDRIEDGPDASV